MRFKDKNNQKKVTTIFASGIINTTHQPIMTGHLLFTLPEASLITKVHIYTGVPCGINSGNPHGSVNIEVSGYNITSDILVENVGVATEEVNKYFPTGGAVKIVSGHITPGADGEIKIIMEYIETELSSGIYTN